MKRYGLHVARVAAVLWINPGAWAEDGKISGLQLAENPLMQVITREPPAPAPITDDFEVRPGYTLIESLDEFRAVIRKNGRKIRMKPGVYRAKKTDPPMEIGSKQGQDDRTRRKVKAL